MTMTLRVVLLVLSVVLFGAVVRMVARDRLQLKYSLLWLLLAVALVVCALFPGIVSWFARLVGVELTSNFVFIAGFVFLIAVCLSLSVIVSWQARSIRLLVQRVALMNEEMDELRAQRDGQRVE